MAKQASVAERLREIFVTLPKPVLDSANMQVNYYAPYFAALTQENFVEPLVYHIYQEAGTAKLSLSGQP